MIMKKIEYPVFADVDEERSLKVLVYRAPALDAPS